MNPLYLFYEKKRVGAFTPDESLRLEFQYDETWIKWSEAFPLSLSLPLQKAVHLHPRPAIFLENLLPEEKIRRTIEQAYKLPKDSPYQFLKEFGEDIAGAFVISEHEEAVSQAGQLIEVPLQTIEDAIEDGQQLYQSMTATYGTKFSLAGAQDKFCIVYQDGKVHVATGSAPSTHIAKVNLDFRNSQTVFNEYFCMKLAEKVGLSVPEVVLIPKPALLIIKRFDRTAQGRTVKRIHQEDFCQAQGIASGQKYEDRGGPGITRNYELIRQHSTQPIKDLEAFLDWIAFNLIIGNNDSHSKNISLLYHEKNIRLAPFYDLLSTTVYERRFSPDFAFKIGSTTRYDAIRRSDIQILEKSIGVRDGKFLKNMARISETIAAHLADVRASLEEQAPMATIGSRIEHEVRQRLKHFRKHGHIIP
ncbi:type II toxin-antitoxin system HipA family toxin [Oligoflexus tunisiensis]|uniref:type II toxin-antitoxin system HipA family toxin n=1 Tax=Oligoflexus tunisiensis TaxID=708132 RepID=UPI000B2304CE|nr:type II toxin-antitoxin system HipA family toxin [Oligoflexus tunisiensis]